MTAQPLNRKAWKTAHGAARKASGVTPRTRQLFPRGYAVREAMETLRPLPMFPRLERSASVAIILDSAADARRDGRPDGARVWLSFAHTRNQLGA